MTTLVKLFEQERDNFTAALAKDLTPEKTVAETRQLLDRLHQRYRAETQSGSVQGRLLPYLIDVLKASVGTLADANKARVWQEQTVDGQQASRYLSRFRRWFWGGLQIVFGLSLASLLITEGSFLDFLVLLGLAASLLYPRLVYVRPLPTPVPRRQKNTARASVEVDLAIFQSRLSDALLTADKLLAQIASLDTDSKQSEGLEAHPAVLGLLQEFLEAKDSDDSTYALKKTHAIPSILESEQIKIEVYNGKNAEFFEFLPSLDPADTGYRTITPALTKKNRLLRRGHVTEPEE